MNIINKILKTTDTCSLKNVDACLWKIEKNYCKMLIYINHKNIDAWPNKKIKNINIYYTLETDRDLTLWIIVLVLFLKC